MAGKLEVEGKEILIKSSNGTMAVIPKDKVSMVKGYIDSGKHEMVDKFVGTLKEFKHDNQKAGDGLYANVHAKRQRIAAGSGERMRKPGEAGAPTAAQFKQAAKTAKAEDGVKIVPPVVKKDTKDKFASNLEVYSKWMQHPSYKERLAKEMYGNNSPNQQEVEKELDWRKKQFDTTKFVDNTKYKAYGIEGMYDPIKGTVQAEDPASLYHEMTHRVDPIAQTIEAKNAENSEFSKIKNTLSPYANQIIKPHDEKYTKNMETWYNGLMQKLSSDLNAGKITLRPNKNFERDKAYWANKKTGREGEMARFILEDYFERNPEYESEFLNTNESKMIAEGMSKSKPIERLRYLNNSTEMKAKINSLRIQAFEKYNYDPSKPFDINNYPELKKDDQYKELTEKLKMSDEAINELSKYIAKVPARQTATQTAKNGMMIAPMPKMNQKAKDGMCISSMSTMKQKAADGVKIVPPVKRKPIVVTNPKDPRLKAYQDSLFIKKNFNTYPPPKGYDQALKRVGQHPASDYFPAPQQPVVLKEPIRKKPSPPKSGGSTEPVEKPKPVLVKPNFDLPESTPRPIIKKGGKIKSVQPVEKEITPPDTTPTKPVTPEKVTPEKVTPPDTTATEKKTTPVEKPTPKKMPKAIMPTRQGGWSKQPLLMRLFPKLYKK
jgi:hypothetical protein